MSWPIHIILVFCVSCFNSIESLLDIVQHTAIPHMTGRTTLVIIFIRFFPFSILVILSLTSPGSCDQDPIILVFSIHYFSKCLALIFILVMVYYIIRDSGIIDIQVQGAIVVPTTISMGPPSYCILWVIILIFWEGRDIFLEGGFIWFG